LPSSSTESPVLRVSVTTDGCQSTLPTRSGHPRHSRTNRNIFVDKRHRLCYERQPCSPTGVSRERSLKRQRGRRFGSAAVERREARPPPYLPPPRERYGGGMPRPKRSQVATLVAWRGSTTQRLPALRSRRFRE
jgi:hypothetical protein